MPSMAWSVTSMAWPYAIDGMVDDVDGMVGGHLRDGSLASMARLFVAGGLA
jgi:hypothetical protein